MPKKFEKDILFYLLMSEFAKMRIEQIENKSIKKFNVEQYFNNYINDLDGNLKEFYIKNDKTISDNLIGYKMFNKYRLRLIHKYEEAEIEEGQLLSNQITIKNPELLHTQYDDWFHSGKAPIIIHSML